MVLVQEWPFFQFFFWPTIDQENVFCDILERKNAFLGYKNKKFKKSKNWHFSKGINPWFWSNYGHFPTFFWGAIYGRKMSFMIFENEKTPFQAITRRSSKSRKDEIFPKGFKPRFWAKTGQFSSYFFLGNIGQEYSFMLF